MAKPTTDAKNIIRKSLAELDLPAYKLTARTISFVDLARASCVFVQIHGWQSNPRWDELRSIAIKNGFRIEVG